jgi:thiopeptide-type bacteriocin biosynthesis protein
MNIPYGFHPDLMVRIPRYGYESGMEAFDMDTLVRDAAAMEAIFLASPVLHAELVKYREGRITDKKEVMDLTFSLGKYYSRMRSRCTPFGLFSGCGMAAWSDGGGSAEAFGPAQAQGVDPEKPVGPAQRVGSVERDPAQRVGSVEPVDRQGRHTRLDMHYLCSLAQHLASLPYIRNRLLYYPNSSWYTLGEEMRYVEYKYVSGRRHHLITSVSWSDHLAGILRAAENGITWAGIVALLMSEDIDEEEANGFVSELAEAQVLVSELEPAITGDEFLPQIIGVLRRIPEAAATAALLEDLHARIGALDEAGHHDEPGCNVGVRHNDVAAYQEIKDLIARMGLPFDEAKLFQADATVTLTDNRVDASLQQQLLEGLDILNQLSKAAEPPALQSFIQRFYQRYEDREVPLLEALDTESGIGYLENYSGTIAPLIDDMVVPHPGTVETRVPWGRRDSFLLRKLTEALAAGDEVIELQLEDFAGSERTWDDLPPSLSVIFRLVDGDRVLLEGVGGSSAVNLLGRFAHGDPAVRRLVGDIVDAEDRMNPDVIFAEVVHLPESRTGNVLLHPAFRAYEIPFLARPSVDADYRIPLQDLLVSVKNQRVVLRSKRLNKVIVPRLSTAHNFRMKALPVYEFLCDLQLHGKQNGMSFTWGIFDWECRRLPRVVYKNIVLNAAQWVFYKKDLADIKDKKGPELMAAVAEFRRRWKLPVLLFLADGDNELLINLEDELMTRIFLDEVKKRPQFMLKEFLPPADGAHAVRNKDGRIYANQLVAALIRETPAYTAPASRASISSADVSQTDVSRTAVRQTFSVGSEWIYLKLYCGEKTADNILSNVVHPFVTEWLASGGIRRFFFIRFKDPAFHLRLRLQVSDLSHLGPVLRSFQQLIRPLEEKGFIWKIQQDTYQRELDRYGPSTIELAEELFHYDSLATLEMLSLTDGIERDHIRWLWAIRAADDLLEAMGMTLPQKQALAQYLRDAFHREFKADKKVRSQLSTKYRTHKLPVGDILNRSKDAESPWLPILQPLMQRQTRIRPLAERIVRLEGEGRLEPQLHELLYSYIHMTLNRVIISEPRLHELVMYDLLFTHYRSCIERAKYEIPVL